MRGVRPGLEPVLLADRVGKALAPAVTGVGLVDVAPRVVVYQLGHQAHVVVDGSELDQLAQEGDGADGAEVLVADDGLADGFRLRLRRAEVLADEIEGEDAAEELKRHLGTVEILLRGADVMEQAREGQSGRGQGSRLIRELLSENSGGYGSKRSSAEGPIGGE